MGTKNGKGDYMSIEGVSSIYVVPILLLLLGMTIFVHEFGHYLAARWLGLVVEIFSIGFGPAIWRKKISGIIYQVGFIPFGVFVELPQLYPKLMSLIQDGGEAGSKETGEKNEEEPVKKYPRVEPWKKIVVSLSGALGNIILAVIIAWIVYLVGMPAGPAERSPVIGYVDKDSKAYELGLRTGDEIMQVNNVPIKSWRDFVMEAALHNEITIKYRSSDRVEKNVQIRTEKGMFGEQTVKGVRGLGLCSVLKVEPGMSADQAGIRGGDVIVGFAGGPVYSMEHFSELIGGYRDMDTQIKINRIVGGKRTEKEMTIRPRYIQKMDRVMIGITWNLAAVDTDTVVRPLPSEQLRDHTMAIFKFLKAIVTPKQAKAAAGGVGGPVAIMISYWYIVKASLMLAIWFTGLLNVNLAILNLLPIPVLDGGHIMFALWEIVTRRPASPKVVNVLVNVFVVLFIAFAVFISIRDMDRLTPARKFFKGIVGMEKDKAAVTNSSAAATQPKGGTKSGK